MIGIVSSKYPIPEYFEAVYEVPNDLDVTREEMHLPSLSRVHFAELLSRDKEAITDEMDARITKAKSSKKGK